MKQLHSSQMVLSVDLDTWCHCRWASGSSNSLWPDAKTALRENFGKDRPGDDFTDATRWILNLMDKYRIKATFFVLSEVAQMLPGLIEEIVGHGHEIALHGMYHVDNTRYGLSQFRNMVQESRKIVTDIAGVDIIGYRAPNLIISNEQMNVLNEEGFLYDSSVCPAQTFFGKYSNMTDAPTVPYHPAFSDFSQPGDMDIVELPIPVFPLIKIPAGSGIMTRVVGGWWTKMCLQNLLKTKYGMYYFHPYEVSTTPPNVQNPTFYIRLFCRNIGFPYREFLVKFISNLLSKVNFVTARQLAENI